MKVTVHKDLIATEFSNVIQVSVVVSEEVDELKMPPETFISLISKAEGKKYKTVIQCESTVIMTVVDDNCKEELK